jgi:hypothetical protein
MPAEYVPTDAQRALVESADQRALVENAAAFGRPQWRQRAVDAITSER